MRQQETCSEATLHFMTASRILGLYGKEISMQGKVVPLGSKAVTIYYLLLFILTAFSIAAVSGIFWSVSHLPPCTSISTNICGVNDWPIAGLTATILGVAATVLAFLGAFAVAVFWKDLNQGY